MVTWLQFVDQVKNEGQVLELILTSNFVKNDVTWPGYNLQNIHK